MELNRKHIIKALECCIEGTSEACLKCSFRLTPPYPVCKTMIQKHALALITSQERRIFELENRLKECENGYEGTLHLERAKLHDAEEKVKELTEEVADWKAIAEGYQKQFEDCAEDRARLTEENYTWQKQLISTQEQADKAYYELACEVEDLRAENERLNERLDREAKCQYELATQIIDLRDDVKYVKSDIVRQMQERLKTAFEEDVKYDGFRILIWIDQIAKEILEGDHAAERRTEDDS